MPKSVSVEPKPACIHDAGLTAVGWEGEFCPMAYVREDHLGDLLSAGLVLAPANRFGLHRFHPGLTSGSESEASFQAIAWSWYQQGRLPAWRNECFDLYSPGSTTARFKLERVAARHLGFWTEAVHVNGIASAGQSMWLARRSMHKDSDPGLLDNMVAGGLSAGESIEQCLWRECWEEAGLLADGPNAAALRAGLKALKPIHMQCLEGLDSAWPHLRRERLYVFSLGLASDLAPSNQDGEVSEYLCVDRAQLRRLIAANALTSDAALVAGLWLEPTSEGAESLGDKVFA
ncbi:MAG: NUDIX domain-containing protein [Betaproteobacteria bacterium]|nr:NUDIX domain-containing protein [Betaproteobacteria bacterium]